MGAVCSNAANLDRSHRYPVRRSFIAPIPPEAAVSQIAVSQIAVSQIAVSQIAVSQIGQSLLRLFVAVWVAVAPPSPHPQQCLEAPVRAPVVAGFRSPSCPYCSGHRGIDYAVAEATVVRAAASGVVTFSGVVVGTRYLVVASADGIAVTYGLLTGTQLLSGDAVLAGQEVGHASWRFYFGVRRNGEYVDPAPLIAGRRFRHRLVPLAGFPARRAKERASTCIVVVERA